MRGAAAAAALLLAGCGGSGTGAPPLGAVLITLDTTNRDALGCYGQPPGLTPNLDRLAEEGIVFDQARTVAPLTMPAHASMLTGLVPLRHGVRANARRPLPDGADTLAERLRAAGFATGAFVSAVVLAAPYGLAQGFDVYDAPQGSRAGGPTAHMLERPAAETFAAAGAWLAARDRSRPFFLWVHAFEPHEPYAPPPEALARARGNAYLGEVAALDDALGELLALLEREHGLDRTVIVVAGDHGEMLGEHGEPTHSVLVYERALRVPLIARLPGRARAGERIDAAASVTDVMPTVLDALGLPVPEGLDGASLLGALPTERGTYFESYTGWLSYGWSPLAGWSDGRTKLLHGTEPELYDLAADPAELRNLHVERPDEVARARAALAELAARPRLAAAAEPLDEDLAADVASLGYAGEADAWSELPEPLADTGLPPPRERMGELERFYSAVLRHNRGAVDAAIAELEALVAENPGNARALNVLATYLFQRGEHARALAALERIPEHATARVTVQDLAGHCLEALGRTAEALERFEHALRLRPDDAHQRGDVARLRAALGR